MNDGFNRSDKVPTTFDSADAIRKQWESQRQELMDRITVLELENENLKRIVRQQDDREFRAIVG